MNTYTRYACMLFTVFLALAWIGALSANDAPATPPAPPAEKKAESPSVKQPSPAVKEKPAGKAPAAKDAGRKPAVKKAPPQKVPAKSAAVPEKKPDEKKPAPKAPAEEKRVEKKTAGKKPVGKSTETEKGAVTGIKEQAAKEALPAIEPEPPKPYYRIIRADVDDAVFADWSALRTDAELRNWAKSQGLVLANDAPPLVGNRARFAQRYGSTLKLDGLDRNSKYRLYLDFVTFDDPSRLNIPAALEIYTDGLLVKRLSFGEMSPYLNPVVLDIPYQLAMDGTVEVLFREHSRTGGFFGLWDAVLTDQYALPATFDEPKRERAAPKSMQVKDAPLEARPAVKKRPARIRQEQKKEVPANEKPAEGKGPVEKPAKTPDGKKTDETIAPPDGGKTPEKMRTDPVAPEIKKTPSVKDPMAPKGPAAPQQPK
ncbi:MAG TPA: hypothetical protein VLM75_11435 [Spirochaetota bacterium]|nr:hypothetical protein [Spirochaetota bacterium]